MSTAWLLLMQLSAAAAEQRMLGLLARQCWRVMLMVAGPLDDGV
jgi:hypothetical protein